MTIEERSFATLDGAARALAEDLANQTDIPAYVGLCPLLGAKRTCSSAPQNVCL
jgi:hypothetical protein